MYAVFDLGTGKRLAGEPSQELIAASRRAYWRGRDIGVVHAYEDDRGVWQYVAPDRVEVMSRSETTRPRRVSVEGVL